MAPLSPAFFSRHLQHLRAGFSHAFAVRSEHIKLTADDAALLDRVAHAVVARGLAAPALLCLESLGPMNFLGSQALHALAPIVECVVSGAELAQVARLLEQRETVTRLITRIEAQAAAQRGAAAR